MHQGYPPGQESRGAKAPEGHGSIRHEQQPGSVGERDHRKGKPGLEGPPERLTGSTQPVDVDVRLGVVEYRDHPPQDTMVFQVHPLVGDFRAARKYLDSLRASGGGDEPEAVFAGVVAACRELSWRRHARRMAMLVGDAPPHGVGCRGDGFPGGCPSGEMHRLLAEDRHDEARELAGFFSDVFDGFYLEAMRLGLKPVIAQLAAGATLTTSPRAR